MVFNPFFNLDRDQVVEAISDVQERLITGAAKVAHAGSGGIDNYSLDQDERNLTFLAKRLAQIDGTADPTRAQVKAYVINPRGYGHAWRRPKPQAAAASATSKPTAPRRIGRASKRPATSPSVGRSTMMHAISEIEAPYEVRSEVGPHSPPARGGEAYPVVARRVIQCADTYEAPDAT